MGSKGSIFNILIWNYFQVFWWGYDLNVSLNYVFFSSNGTWETCMILCSKNPCTGSKSKFRQWTFIHRSHTNAHQSVDANPNQNKENIMIWNLLHEAWVILKIQFWIQPEPYVEIPSRKIGSASLESIWNAMFYN